MIGRGWLLFALTLASVALCFAGGPSDMPIGVLSQRVTVLDSRVDTHDVAIASHLVRLDGHDGDIASHVLDIAAVRASVATNELNIASHTLDIAARALLGGNPAQSFAALNITASGTLRVASDAAFLTNTPASTAWYPTEQ